MTHALTTAARRLLEAARIVQAGEARAAQLADTPRQPTDPVIRLIKEKQDE